MAEKLFEDVSSEDFLKFKFGPRSYTDQLHSAIARTGETSAVSCEVRTIDGRPVMWLTHNFRFLGGSLGCAEGEVLSRGFEHGTKNGY